MRLVRRYRYILHPVALALRAERVEVDAKFPAQICFRSPRSLWAISERVLGLGALMKKLSDNASF